MDQWREREREVYCWTVRWQEREGKQMFKHFYPKDPAKGPDFGYSEEAVKAFVAGLQCNSHLQHSDFLTVWKGSRRHQEMVRAANETSKLIDGYMKARKVSVAIKTK